MELYELLETVCDRESFFRFIQALIDERRLADELERQSPSSPYGPDACGWKNTSIGMFLDAALGWAQDTNMGVRQGLSASPSWKEFAVFLYLGKIYD